jgi:predicted dehydrogenase
MSGIRVGIVGAGAIAGRHAGVLAGFDDVRVAAVADPALDRAEELAGQVGATAYAGHLDMLDREGLDAVYICVPPFAHGPPERSAIDAGLPFFVEKPLAIDLPAAASIAAAVADRGLVTATGYHWRYLDTFERAQELLTGNPARLALGYWLDTVPPPAWWVHRQLSGGQMIEQTTHALDLARVLVGEVTAVHAVCARTERAAYPQADVDDVWAATLRFETGAVGSVASSCLTGWKHRAGIHLVCEGMVIELSEPEMVVHAGGEPTVHRATADTKTLVDRDFVDAVAGRADRVRVPYGEALRTHRVACALVRSAEDGRPLRLDGWAPGGQPWVAR